ncbi:MAG: SDR family NAD(P)-dependent oxidoreductase [Actinomycetota bacterium]|nr:SDR family NAD(P)-dependent oxidoreductase [Actinomycetota bacterium]
MSSPHRSVLIIGASKGLGQALAARYLELGSRVVATVRGEARTPLHELLATSTAADNLEIEHVDITEADQVDALRTRLDGRRFDLLFVNAGVTSSPEETTATVTTEEFTRLMVTNALSPLRVIETLGDLVPPEGTIAVMSSRQGSIAANTRGGFEIYRASKSALNQLMRSYAARHADDPRTLILMAPGWIKTDLGGENAPLTIDESIPSVVATLDAQHGAGGLQFLSYLGETVPW